jgi:HSP20 family molecular chaperone IbpA
VQYHRWMGTSRPSHDRVVEATGDLATTMVPQRVPVNAYETTGAFVVVAPLPAVTENDVTIELTSGLLRFWADLRSAAPRDYSIHEWEYGGYERSIELPPRFRADVEGTLCNGQLVIRVLEGPFQVDRAIHPVAR